MVISTCPSIEPNGGAAEAIPAHMFVFIHLLCSIFSVAVFKAFRRFTDFDIFAESNLKTTVTLD